MKKSTATQYMNFDLSQGKVYLWLNNLITNQSILEFTRENRYKLGGKFNPNDSVFLSLFNSLDLNDQSNISNYLNNEDKSNTIQNIYRLEQGALKQDNFISAFIEENNISVEDISTIKKLTEFLYKTCEVHYKDIIKNTIDKIFKDKTEALLNENNIDYMVKNISLLNINLIKLLIESPELKLHLQKMINNNEIEEIKTMINEYINIFDVGFEGIKNLLDNIFGLNLQNNKELKDFINKRSYALIAGLVCSSFTNEYNESYDEEYPDYTPEDFTKNNITNINTQQFVKLLNYKEDSMVSGKDMLISSKDIPDVFDDEEVFIKLCYTALSRVIHNIKYGECKKIHEELFEEELELESESELEQPVLASLNLPHNASTDQIQGNRQIQGNSKDFFPIIQ